MKNKKGWMMILEATIAILIVSGALLVVYSQQTDRSILPEEYYDDLQGQILADVSSSSDLRLNVLNVVEENSGDGNFTILNEFIGGKIPDGFGYSIRVCELGSETDFCKLDSTIFIATLEKDIYTEEIIIASELGSGFDAVYNPKKLRLFVWEGDDIEMDCEDECWPVGPVFNCSPDSTQVFKKTCDNFDEDNCLEWDGEFELWDECEEGEVCIEDTWICDEVSGLFNLTCEKTKSGHVYDFNDECGGWDANESECLGWNIFEWCTGGYDYTCYDYEEVECSVDPECPNDYIETSRSSCVPEGPCVDECTEDKKKCSADLKQVLIQECGDFDDDECDELDPVYKVDDDCDPDEECVDEECVKMVAVLNLDFTLQTILDDDPYMRYIHTRTFSETKGVGVTLTEGQLCYLDGSCDEKGSVPYRIEGNDELVHKDKKFNLFSDSQKFILKYWGTDDNDNDVYVEQTVCVERDSFLFDVGC